MLGGFARDVAKSMLDVGQNAYGKLARSAGLIDFPVPPNSNMRRTSSTRLAHYRLSGIKTGLPIATAAMIAGYRFEAGSHVLDFGAGVARQLNYFTRRYPNVNFHACDVERSAIDWLKTAYPRVDSYASEYLPPLKFEDKLFSLIYSVSIFSHLTERDCGLWLKEFARVTKPGGVFCVTTMGFPALTARTTDYGPEKADALRDRGTLHYDYDASVRRGVQNLKLVRNKDMLDFLSDDYGVTFFSPDYIERHWNSGDWEVAGIAEGVIDDLQDLITLRRR